MCKVMNNLGQNTKSKEEINLQEHKEKMTKEIKSTEGISKDR